MRDRAYQTIKTRILDRSYAPGRRLRAQELAESMAISRTPVREAFGRLEQEGLLRREDGWGFTVRGLTAEEIIELFEVREALEQGALSLAIPRLGEDQLAHLGRLLEGSAAALDRGRPADSIRIARQFHFAIATASGNGLLANMIESLNERIHKVGLMLAARFPKRPSEVLAENQALLQALVARDARRAARILKSHIRRSRDLVLGVEGRRP
jgi:DNA-binding GntR family transcriptional regulator